MKNKVFIFLGLIFFIASLYSQETFFSGTFSAQGTGALREKSDLDSEKIQGDFIEKSISLEGNIKHYLDNNIFYADGYVKYNDVEECFEGSIKEAWADYSGEWFAVRIGRQIAGWGKADEIQVTDVLCPQNVTTAVAADYSETRMGIDALRISFMKNEYALDAYWIPIFTPAKLPESKSNWLYRYFIPDEIQPLWDGFEKPELNISNSEYALRLNANFSFADFSMYGFYGWDDEPVSQVEMVFDDNASAYVPSRIFGEYKRMSMVGLDAAIPAGDFVFRLEGAFFPQKYFNVNEEILMNPDEDSYVCRNLYKGLVGFDWAPYPFTITAQYYIEGIQGNLDELEEGTDRIVHKTSLSISRTFLNENLEIGLSGVLRFNDMDSFVEAYAEYKLSDSITVSLYGDFFNRGIDDENGEYGLYRDFSSITAKLQYRF